VEENGVLYGGRCCRREGVKSHRPSGKSAASLVRPSRAKLENLIGRKGFVIVPDGGLKWRKKKKCNRRSGKGGGVRGPVGEGHHGVYEIYMRLGSRGRERNKPPVKKGKKRVLWGSKDRRSKRATRTGVEKKKKNRFPLSGRGGPLRSEVTTGEKGKRKEEMCLARQSSQKFACRSRFSQKSLSSGCMTRPTGRRGNVSKNRG